MPPDRSPYAPLPVAEPVVTPSPLAPTVDPRGAAAAMFAALVAAPGVLLPVPWSAAWGAMVAIVALGYARSVIGGGRAGAVAGALIGIAVGAPAAVPLFVSVAFSPFAGESPGLGSDGMVVRLSASMAAVVWAVLAAIVAVPLAFSIVGRLAPSSPRLQGGGGGLSRVSRAVPVLVLLHLVPVTIAELAAVPDLVAKIAAAGVRTDAIAVWAAAAGFVAYGLVRLAFWGGAVLMLRRGFRIAPLPVSGGTSAVLGGIFVGAVWLPAAWLGMSIALGPLAGIIPWSEGGVVTVDWTKLYNWTAEPGVLFLLAGLWQTQIALGLIGLARKIGRAWELRRAPYRLPPIRKG